MRRLLTVAAPLLLAVVAVPPSASGSAPAPVTYGEHVLVTTAERLDRAASSVPPGVTSWYADPGTDRVVMTVRPGAEAAARAFGTRVGVVPGTVKLVVSDERPTWYADVRGGDPYTTSPANGFRCSVGFTVVGGFVTNRHCGRVGMVVYTPAGARMGVFTAVSSTTADWAHVRLDPGWRPVGQVRGPSGTHIPVRGSVAAPVGATVCRFGNTTGWRCGVIQARNVTIIFAGGGVLYGMTRTNVCAEPGDSGAPMMAGNQAQGMISGGSGNCTVGGVSYFQPINTALTALGLTLVTSPAIP
nr:S1 family peptidase [Micromonospora sp. DSM 115978]